MKEELPNPSDELPIFYGCEPEPDAVVEHFSHLVVAVTDLDRSEAWYRDVIGLDFLGRGLTAEPQPHAVLQMNTGQLIILVQYDEIDTVRQNAQGVHHGFALTQNQYRQAVNRLRAAGIDVVAQREEFIARGQYSIDVYDPDGHHYQIETMDEIQSHEVLLPNKGTIDCGPADSYESGEVKLFRDANFFLVRIDDGFLALTRWCSHLNGLLVYQKEHWRFWCAMHTATYDRRGNPTCSSNRFPDLKALRLHPVSFSADGHVLVNTDEVVERAAFAPEQLASIASPPVSAS
ncbi:MAG TPA: VOC family protein [Chloroflexota bacterium]|nr:VOC family protein [Chloroflexota bacterium]